MKKLGIIFILLFTACNSGNDSVKNQEKLSSDDVMKCPIGICEYYKNKQTYEMANDYFTASNLSKVSPVNFLQYLKNFQCYDIMVPACRFPIDWINKSNLPSLLAVLDDKTPCTKIHVASIKNDIENLDSSHIQSSTIGLESLRLINGYLLKQYPCDIKWSKDSILLVLNKF